MNIDDKTYFDRFDTATINRQDKEHFLHPFQVFDVFSEEGALPIAAARDAYIYDSDGRKYLDAVGGLWCTNIGLGREEMADAIANQADSYPHLRLPTTLYVAVLVVRSLCNSRT